MSSSNTNRIEKRIQLKATPARVWRALTDYKEFGEWFRVNLVVPFAPGQPSHGDITYPGYEHLTMEIVVRKMDAERLFSYHWHPYAVDPNVDYSTESPTLVEFTLQPVDGGTWLTVTESGFDALPAERRVEAFRMHDEGWAEQMQNIEKHIQDKPD